MADFVEKPETIEFLLWVSHGANVSDDSSYYYFPYDYKFDYLVMYSKPLKIATADELRDLIANPCDLVTGSCPFLPITQESGKKNIYLPPLLFGVKDPKTETLKEYMGLWHFTINKTDLNNCIITRSDRVITYDDIYKEYNLKNKPKFTYSSIFKMVKDYCTSLGVDNVSDVLLGIYSCQVLNAKYLDQNPVKNKISTFVPRIKDRKIIIVFDTDFTGKTYLPLYIPFQSVKMHDWTALGGIVEQGCGLNILSYYDLMPVNEARQEMTCLYKGTSIFKIVQYIADGLNQYETNPFLIIRYPLYNHGINIILQLIHNLPNDSAIILKIYKDALHNDKPSHIGHTFSIFRGDDHFYIIDPQLGVDTSNMEQYEFTSPEHLLELMQQVYPHKQWVDIVFYNTNLQGNFTIEDLHQQNNIGPADYGILTDAAEVSYGGRGKARSRRTRYKGKGRTRKSKRGRGEGRGKEDEKGKIKEIFKILKETDSKNGVKTALVNDSTVIEKHEESVFSPNSFPPNSFPPNSFPPNSFPNSFPPNSFPSKTLTKSLSKSLSKSSPKLLPKTSPILADKP